MKDEFDLNEEFDPDSDWRRDIPFGLLVIACLLGPFIGFLIWMSL